MKTLLKKGDEFIPIKPKNRFESPTWPEDMDILNNTLQIVKDISPTGFIISETNFSFHPDWCTKVEEPMKRKVSLNVKKYTNRINEEISKSEPMKAGLETITDTHIATTHKVTDKEVDIQIQKLKEVINPDPYKIYEGRISDDEADAKEYERVKWEVRRYELAKAAMQGIIVNATSFDYVAELVRESLDFADEMIKQLKGE
jgi:hypothetical protein